MGKGPPSDNLSISHSVHSWNSHKFPFASSQPFQNSARKLICDNPEHSVCPWLWPGVRQVTQSVLGELNWALLLASRSLFSAEENVLEAPSPLSLPLVSKYVLVCIHAVPLRDSVVSSSWLLFTNKGVSSKGALPTADASWLCCQLVLASAPFPTVRPPRWNPTGRSLRSGSLVS